MLHSAVLKGCLRSLNVQFSDVRNFASMDLKSVVRKLEEFAPTSLGNLLSPVLRIFELPHMISFRIPISPNNGEQSWGKHRSIKPSLNAIPLFRSRGKLQIGVQ